MPSFADTYVYWKTSNLNEIHKSFLDERHLGKGRLKIIMGETIPIGNTTFTTTYHLPLTTKGASLAYWPCCITALAQPHAAEAVVYTTIQPCLDSKYILISDHFQATHTCTLS